MRPVRFATLLALGLASCSDVGAPGGGVVDASITHDAAVIDVVHAPESGSAEDARSDADRAACDACTAEHCAADLAACQGEPECDAYLACAGPCGPDQACSSNCAQKHPAGHGPAQVLASCQSRACTAPCGIEDGWSCGWQLIDETCGSCGLQQCCDIGYEAFHTPDLWAYLDCVNPCSADDLACWRACRVTHALGYAMYAVFLSCLGVSCSDACIGVFGEPVPCGLVSPGTGTCDTCSAEHCCDQMKQASLSAEQWEYAACLGGCLDDACFNQCAGRYPNGRALNLTVLGCASNHCKQECGSAWDFPACGLLGYPTADCRTCTEAQCCDELRTESESPAFWAYHSCWYGCATDACRTQCIADYPDGATYDEVTSGCIRTHCADACWVGTSVCGIYRPGSSCPPCIEDQCCQASVDCVQDYDCSRIDLCRVLSTCDPADTACLDACRSANPAGVAMFDALHACRTGPCAAECEGY